MSYTIVTDTSANIPSEMAEEKGIVVIPLSFYIDGAEQICLDTTHFGGREFYDRMRAGQKISTSQITPQRYVEYLEPILTAGQDVLFVGMSAGISGSFHSANIAASELLEQHPNRKIRLLDTMGASLGEGLIALKADEYRRQGMGLDETAETLTNEIRRMYQVFTVDDLEYLRAGGRLSNASAFLGKILGIKPLLKGNEVGKIVSFATIRGRKKIIAALAQKYSELVVAPEAQVVGISHADCDEDAQQLAELIRAAHAPKDILIVQHEPATGSYLGPGALALYFFGADDVRLQ